MIKSDKYYKREEERSRIRQKKEEQRQSTDFIGNTKTLDSGDISVDQKGDDSFSITVGTNKGNKEIDLDNIITTVENLKSKVINLNGLTDVDTTTISPSPKEFLRYNGTIWENEKYQLEGNVTNATTQVGGLLTTTNISNWTVDEILKRIIIPAPVPTVSLTALATTLRYNTGTTLNWSSTNATSLLASNGWAGEKIGSSTNGSGSEATGNLITNKTYTLTASSEGGSNSSSVTVTVMPIPSPPPNLSGLTLAMSNSFYTAKLTSDGSTKTNVIYGTVRPVATVSNFSDGSTTTNGANGTLTAYIDGVNSGSRALTPGINNDTGYFGSLHIINDEDPYSGIYNSGWFTQLDAEITPNVDLSYGTQHTYKITHSGTSGSTPDKTFYIDNPTTPSISGMTAVIKTGAGVYISGIQFATVITVTFSSTNTVGAFYRNGIVHQVSSSNTATGTYIPTGANPSTNSKEIDVTVNAGAFDIDGFSFTCTAYNSIGTAFTDSFPSSILIDKNSIETDRSTSGEGLYPVSFGNVYNSTQSLTLNKELQLLNNYYKYPLTSSLFYPGITGDNIDGIHYRWATFNVGTKSTAVNNLTINIPYAVIGSNLDSIKMFIKIGSSGWVDATKEQSVASPYSNGDGALDMASTTLTSRKITFGQTPRSGIVFVRIGIKSTDNFYFQKPTMI